MTQVFNTTQEARQWMMAHPMREVSSKDEDYTCIYRWNPSEFTFEYLNLKNKWEPASVDYCLHSFAVIDPEPTPNDWEEVPIYPEGMDDTGWELLEKERLKYILTHASEVRIAWPEWYGGIGLEDTRPFNAMAKQLFFFALQIGAKVYIKRREGV